MTETSLRPTLYPHPGFLPLLYSHKTTNSETMGNANPLAAAAANKQAGDIATQAQEGLNVLTAGQTEEERKQNERAKDRNAAFEQKKREREERKKKLQSQWAAHKKS